MSKHKKKVRSNSKRRIPHTAEELFAKSDRDQETWHKVLRAIAKMRTDGLSLKKAAKEAGVTPRTVTNWGGRAIKKGNNGRYFASKRDSLLRVLQVPASHGSREISLRDSHYASTISKYHDAVQKYLRTGDSSQVEKFRGKRIKDANGHEIPLVTDLVELNRLGSAGVLSFESMYSRVA